MLWDIVIHPSIMMTHYVRSAFNSPLGMIEVRGSAKGILSIMFVEREHPETGIYTCLQHCMHQLHGYFSESTDGYRGFHSLPLVIHGTEFQMAVWDQVINIPFGETRTYGELAKAIGEPKAYRAVGTAVGHNPLSLLIPCHRVLPASGDVGEYAWGSWRKQWLLDHERLTVQAGLLQE